MSCDRLIDIVLERAQKAVPPGEPILPYISLDGTDCKTIEETFQTVVDRYLSVILALLGGGSAGVAVERRRSKGDESG